MLAVVDNGLQLGIDPHHLGLLLPADRTLEPTDPLLLAELPAVHLSLADLVGLHELQSLHAGAVLVVLNRLPDAPDAGRQGLVVLLGLLG